MLIEKVFRGRKKCEKFWKDLMKHEIVIIGLNSTHKRTVDLLVVARLMFTTDAHPHWRHAEWMAIFIISFSFSSATSMLITTYSEMNSSFIICSKIYFYNALKKRPLESIKTLYFPSSWQSTPLLTISSLVQSHN